MIWLNFKNKLIILNQKSLIYMNGPKNEKKCFSCQADITCIGCNGWGFTDCVSCNGKGYIGMIGNYHGPCFGTGKVTCSFCKGIGQSKHLCSPKRF